VTRVLDNNSIVGNIYELSATAFRVQSRAFAGIVIVDDPGQSDRVETFELMQGQGNDFTQVNLSTTSNKLPDVVVIDGGGGTDDQVNVVGTDQDDNLSFADRATVSANDVRAPFELAAVERFRAQGGEGSDDIYKIREMT
jgi:hypothetical protein